MKIHHPDSQTSDNDKGANTRFIEINEAYDTLSDKDKKREYDLVTSEYKRKENLRKRYVPMQCCVRKPCKIDYESQSLYGKQGGNDNLNNNARIIF